MASKLLSRARAVSARLRHPRTLSPTLAAFAPKRLLSDVAPRPLPAAGDSPPASASPTPQSSGSAGKFKFNGKGSSARSSLKDPELVKFSAIADTRWDSEGPFKLLHRMNPTRLAFIRSTLCRHFGKDPYSARPFEGLKIVDVGCGGGLLSEPLARMGASVLEPHGRVQRLASTKTLSEEVECAIIHSRLPCSNNKPIKKRQLLAICSTKAFYQSRSANSHYK